MALVATLDMELEKLNVKIAFPHGRHSNAATEVSRGEESKILSID